MSNRRKGCKFDSLTVLAYHYLLMGGGARCPAYDEFMGGGEASKTR